MKKLGFGIMRLPLINEDDPTSININEFKEMVDYFMKKGFNYFDTGYPYHKGHSETAIKEALTKRYPRDSYILTDKLPIFSIENANQMETIFNEQLERCGVDYFDYYLLHNVSSAHKRKFTEIDSFKFVLDKKNDGKIKHMGISCHDNPEFLDNILTQHPEIEIVQLQINYFDWKNDAIQSKKCYEVARKHDKPIIVMEPLRGGALMRIPEKAMKIMKKYDNDAPIASWGIRFSASLNGVFTVLSGMSSIEQLKENISYMENFKKISNEEKDILEKIVKEMNKNISIACTSCKYCLDACPMHIPIPKYFELYNSQKQLNKAELYGMYYRNITSQENFGKPSDCIECKKCMELCPQHLNIPEYIKDVLKEFES